MANNQDKFLENTRKGWEPELSSFIQENPEHLTEIATSSLSLDNYYKLYRQLSSCVKILQNDDRELEMRQRAVRALKTIVIKHSLAIPIVVNAILSSQDKVEKQYDTFDVNAALKDILVQSGKHAISYCVSMITNPPKHDQFYLIPMALGEIGQTYPEEVLDILIPLFKEGDKETKKTVVCALERMEKSAAPALDMLTRFLYDHRHENNQMLLDIVKILGNTEESKATIHLTNLFELKDEDPLFQKAILEALGKIGDLPSRLILIRALEDEALARTATEALDSNDDTNFIQSLEENPELAIAAHQKLAERITELETLEAFLMTQFPPDYIFEMYRHITSRPSFRERDR